MILLWVLLRVPGMARSRLVGGCGPGYPLAGLVGGAFHLVGTGGEGGYGGLPRARIFCQAKMRSA